MISIIVCSKNPNSYLTHYNTIKAIIGTEYEYIRIDNTGNLYGICAAYNKGVEKAKGETIIFLHEDVFVITPGWGKIIKEKFSANNSIGLIGVAGTQYLYKDSPFWAAPGRPYIHGKVIHEEKDKNRLILTVFSEENQDKECVAVDGLFFAVRSSLFNNIHFDEETFSKFHFYDLDICMQVRKSHQVIVTSDILVKHLSGGTFKEEWKNYGKLFLNKYQNELPASTTNTTPDPSNRDSFDSFPLNKVVTPKTFEFIKNLGKESDKSHTFEDITVVTGMHRSGTSAISGLLNKCDLSLGPNDNLLFKNAPLSENQKGHFENQSVVYINEIILKTANGSWSNLPSQKTINDKGEINRERIIHFANTFPGALVKDPRLCLTINIWKKYCKRIKNIVICVRHPLGVANSLKERDNIPIAQGVQLWYDYNTMLINNIKNFPAVIVNYDNLSHHLHDDLYSIIKILGITITKKEMIKKIEGFFDTSLNHNPITEIDINPLPAKVKELYQHLKSQSIAVKISR